MRIDDEHATLADTYQQLVDQTRSQATITGTLAWGQGQLDDTETVLDISVIQSFDGRIGILTEDYCARTDPSLHIYPPSAGETEQFDQLCAQLRNDPLPLRRGKNLV